MPPLPPEQRRLEPKAALISTVVWGIVGALSTIAGMLSMMMFDAPGSQDNRYLWILFGAIWSLPFLCFISVSGGWILYAAHREWAPERAYRARGLRVAFSLLPLLWIIVIGVAYALFQAKCHGRFVCG